MFNNSISQWTVTSYENNSSTESYAYVIKTETGVSSKCWQKPAIHCGRDERIAHLDASTSTEPKTEFQTTKINPRVRANDSSQRV
jgi:hypothetical protein